MKKTLMILSVFILFSASERVSFADGGDFPASGQAATDHVIVTLKEEAHVNMRNSTPIAGDGLTQDQMVSMEVPADQTIEAFIEQLEKNENIQEVEPDFLVKLAYTSNDPELGKSQYHHKKLETKLAWDKTRGSEDVIVAVIDDGVDVSHPEFKNRIVHPFDTVKENSNIAVGLHGTHVAGIIGSSIDNGIGGAGIAPNAKIMPINVFEGEYAFTSEIIQGIYYAIEQGADIINLSLGGYAYSNAFNAAIQAAHEKGIVIVAAAGNEKKELPYYPAAYPNVISVASTTSTDRASEFSNFGKTIDIAAPGSSIYSTLPKNAYGFLDGTSMAAPMISGVAALIKSSEPALSNRDIENRLFATADDLGVIGKDPIFGHGRVNARKALLIGYLPPPTVSGVFQYSTAVKGSATANAIITVKLGTNVLNTSVADSKGKFAVTIPKQKIGTKLIVFSSNDAGVVSTEKEVIVKDGIAPSVPLVNPVSSQSTSLTGKAETAARVYAYAGSVKIGEALSSNGQFSMPVAKQKPGVTISVYAMDAARNKSGNALIKVSDKTAPAMPVVNAVNNSSLAITGKAESNAKVYAYAGKVKLGEAIAKSGAYSIKISKQKAGTALAVYAVDAAQNKSAVRTVKVVAAPTAGVVTYTATTYVNMRSGASPAYRVLTIIPKGAKVYYVKKSGSWFYVKYGLKTGWVYSSYLK